MWHKLFLILAAGAMSAAFTAEATAYWRDGAGVRGGYRPGYYGYVYPGAGYAYRYPFRPGYEDPAYYPNCYGRAVGSRRC